MIQLPEPKSTLSPTASPSFCLASTLISEEDHASWRGIADAIRERLDIHDALVEALQIKVAQQFSEYTMAMAERALELLRRSLNIAPKEQVQTLPRCSGTNPEARRNRQGRR